MTKKPMLWESNKAWYKTTSDGSAYIPTEEAPIEAVKSLKDWYKGWGYQLPDEWPKNPDGSLK